MKSLTVILHPVRDGSYIARGIVEDETVFEHAPFASLQELANYATHFWRPNYEVIINIPSEWQAG